MLLLIDNFDSFTYNIAHAFLALGVEVKVVRNCEDLEAAFSPPPAYLVIGPGPGGPMNTGISKAAFERAHGVIPILGICLGHQLIGSLYGAEIVRAKRPCHGKVDPIYHGGEGIFKGLPTPFLATRYHSLVVDPANLSPNCEVIAATSENEVMAIRDKSLPITGVQFHPESIAGEWGDQLFKSFLNLERFTKVVGTRLLAC